jgi:hypothetical protein
VRQYTVVGVPGEAKMNRSVLLIGLSLLSFALRATAQEPSGSGLLAWAVGAHRAARDGVRSLHCRVQFSSDMPGTPKGGYSSSSECWASPDAIRIEASLPGFQQDSIWNQNTRKSLMTTTDGGRKYTSAEQGTFADMHLYPREDPFAVGLLFLNLPGTVRVITLEELIKEASHVGRVERTKQQESDLVLIQLFFDKQEHEGGRDDGRCRSSWTRGSISSCARRFTSGRLIAASR